MPDTPNTDPLASLDPLSLNASDLLAYAQVQSLRTLAVVTAQQTRAMQDLAAANASLASANGSIATAYEHTAQAYREQAAALNTPFNAALQVVEGFSHTTLAAKGGVQKANALALALVLDLAEQVKKLPTASTR